MRRCQLFFFFFLKVNLEPPSVVPRRLAASGGTAPGGAGAPLLPRGAGPRWRSAGCPRFHLFFLKITPLGSAGICRGVRCAWDQHSCSQVEGVGGTSLGSPRFTAGEPGAERWERERSQHVLAPCSLVFRRTPEALVPEVAETPERLPCVGQGAGGGAAGGARASPASGVVSSIFRSMRFVR